MTPSHTTSNSEQEDNAAMSDGVEELIAWLRKRAEPNSGISYQAQDPFHREGYVMVMGPDATFIASHFHGQGARDLADALVTELQHSRAAEAVADEDAAKWRRAIRSLLVTAEVNDGRDGTQWGHALAWFDAASPASPSATGVREALQEALKLSKLTESLCACRGDDDYVWGVQAKIEAALSALVEQP